MDQAARGNIILIGFSYTGKSIIGKELAQRLDWEFVETDDEVVRLAGKSIPEIFAEDGEPRFRTLERQVLKEACQKKGVVIASGGGAILDADNRELMAKSGAVVCLEAKPQTIHQRLLADAKMAGNSVVRPLLSGPDSQRRIELLKKARQPYYVMADWTVHTDNLTIDEVCQEVLRGWRYGIRRLERPAGAASPELDDAACVVTTTTGSYPVFVGWGVLDELGRRMREVGLSGTATIVSDDEVFFIYGSRVRTILEETGFAVDCFTVPQGERSKSIDTAAKIYDWLIERRVERGHTIVALGGGMVGDLAGFVAATLLRGLPLVHVPTSLLAMVDASIGGKVAVNHPQGKNLIGAFYQPRLVLADVLTLATLPQRELTSGWAEVIKHGLILSPNLFRLLEEHAERLIRLDRELTTEAVRRSAAVKARVVSEDEKETGIRIILNYGHTIGHGLEAATGYERFLHGEAVAIGMMGAAMLSEQLRLLSSQVVKRQQALLQRFGLPTTCSGVDLAHVLKAMELDKKVVKKAVRWVLLSQIGKTVIRDDVPPESVKKVLEKLITD